MKFFKALSVLFVFSILIVSCGGKGSGLYQSIEGTYLKIEGDNVSYFFKTRMGETDLYLKSTGVLKEVDGKRVCVDLKNTSSFQNPIDENKKERSVEIIDLDPLAEQLLCFDRLEVVGEGGELELTATGSPEDIINQKFKLVD